MSRFRSSLLVAVAALTVLAGAPPAGASPARQAPVPAPNGPESPQPDLTSVSPLDFGEAVPPRNPARVAPEPGAARLGAAAVALPPLTFTFKASDYTIADMPRERYPYARTSPIPLVDSGVHDAAGVRMHRIGNTLYDHPVGQAGYGLENLESYLLTDDPAYLNRAKAQAQRLIDRARKVVEAWYLPYPFDFNLHGVAADRMVAPWYSAMAQGQAISLFIRLYEATGDETYRNAADGVFASFLRPRSTSSPWVVWVDSQQHLWLEEYPRNPSDRTLNGHLFATFGLWDYWRLTQDERAKKLYQGAVTMAVDYFPQFRNTSWISQYCLQHPTRLSDKYHLIHIREFFLLFGMSRNLAVARIAENLIKDYPPPEVSGSVRFAAGTHEGVVFTSSGTVSSRKTITLTRASSAPADRRIRIKGQPGFWYRITAGALASHYVQEKWAISTLQGRYVRYDYYPARRATMNPNTQYIGIEFDSAGRTLSEVRVTPTTATSFGVVQTAVFNGREHLLAETGPLAGRWIARYTLVT
jgi:hypothetical protein